MWRYCQISFGLRYMRVRWIMCIPIGAICKKIRFSKYDAYIAKHNHVVFNFPRLVSSYSIYHDWMLYYNCIFLSGYEAKFVNWNKTIDIYLTALDIFIFLWYSIYSRDSSNIQVSLMSIVSLKQRCRSMSCQKTAFSCDFSIFMLPLEYIIKSIQCYRLQ